MWRGGERGVLLLANSYEPFGSSRTCREGGGVAAATTTTTTTAPVCAGEKIFKRVVIKENERALCGRSRETYQPGPHSRAAAVVCTRIIIFRFGGEPSAPRRPCLLVDILIRHVYTFGAAPPPPAPACRAFTTFTRKLCFIKKNKDLLR